MAYATLRYQESGVRIVVCSKNPPEASFLLTTNDRILDFNFFDLKTLTHSF